MQHKEGENLARENGNNNFIMLFREHMPELRWLQLRHPTAKLILDFIMEHMDERNALVCSQKVFTEYFNINRATVTRNVKVLKDNGFIDVVKSGTTNVYITNTEVAWTSYGNQKEYCKFDGKVLISKTDNLDYHYRSQKEKLKALRIKEGIK